jgi:hypothetical protein
MGNSITILKIYLKKDINLLSLNLAFELFIFWQYAINYLLEIRFSPIYYTRNLNIIYWMALIFFSNGSFQYFLMFSVLNGV